MDSEQAPPGGEALREAAEEPEQAGGDPACWAGLVCQECGAVLTEGHRAGCPADPTAPADPADPTA